MSQADNPASRRGQSPADLLIVGAGIMGLWAAVHAERLGLSTVLVDANRPGAGASGGLLGALMAHIPDRWNDKKQFQFDCLVSLEAEIAALETQTSLSAGYRRCGRLIPLPKPHLRRIAEGHMRDAELRWQAEGHSFGWNVIDHAPAEGWIDQAAGACGFVHDTLAARVAPRSLIAMLMAFLDRARHVHLRTGVEVGNIDLARGRAVIGDTETWFSRCIVAAGHHSTPLLQPFFPGVMRPLGQPVKGQAALLDARVDPGLPTIFRDGLYVIAHDGGQVAVGSTSEQEFEDAVATDGKLDRLIADARALVPALADAPVIERWAGLRPKAIGREPMVGTHPDVPRLIALTGGFKVSFGIAHRLAEAAVDMAADRTSAVRLPSSFMLESHVEIASR